MLLMAKCAGSTIVEPAASLRSSERSGSLRAKSPRTLSTSLSHSERGGSLRAKIARRSLATATTTKGSSRRFIKRRMRRQVRRSTRLVREGATGLRWKIPVRRSSVARAERARRLRRKTDVTSCHSMKERKEERKKDKATRKVV